MQRVVVACRSVRKEVWAEVIFGDEAGCLSKDGPAGAGIQLGVRGYR